jgi:hypothetical protein
MVLLHPQLQDSYWWIQLFNERECFKNYNIPDTDDLLEMREE